MYKIMDLILISLGSTGVIGIYLAVYQLIFLKKVHLFNVYIKVMDMIDTPEMREARHYVYEMNSDAFKKEEWLNIHNLDSNKYNQYIENKNKAEKVMRAFAQIGLLVRTGRIPINLIADFYLYCILKCWENLAEYIDAIRRSEMGGRGQAGHMWEFENLCYEILIKGIKSEKGIWKGIMLRDGLDEEFFNRFEKLREKMLRAKHFKRESNLWKLKFW